MVLAAVTVCDVAGGAAPAKRARPPKFSKAVRDAFFPNALEKLVGPRPEKSSAPAPAALIDTPAQPVAANSGSVDWAQFITAEAIEDEIKSRHRMLGETVGNVVEFKSGAYRRARLLLSVLAALFAIDAEHGGQVRWQREAAAVRDQLARAGFNCKVATDASYQDARSRWEDLGSLIRGERIETPPAAGDVTWEKVAGRGPLMVRLEEAEKMALAPWTANATLFAENAEQLAHEAQILAALAVVIAQDGYEYADDETYAQYAGELRSHAVALRDAALAQDYERARAAAGQISKSCSSCHEGYRN